MPAPYNYNIPAPDLAGSIFKGLQVAQAIQGIKANKLAMEQAEQERVKAAALQEQFAADLKATLDNPTQEAWAGMIAKHPKMREGLVDAAKISKGDQSENEWRTGAEISTAIENGAPEVAKEILSREIRAREEAGQPANIYQRVYDDLEKGNVKGAQSTANMVLAMLDPDKFKKLTETRNEVAKEEREKTLFPTLTKMKEAELSKATSEAQTAGIEAKYKERILQAQLNKAEKDAIMGGDAKVQSSEIFQDGTAIVVMSNGGTKVYDPTGKEVSPEQRADTIRKANESGIYVSRTKEKERAEGRLEAKSELGGRAAGAEAAGKQGIELGGKAFESAAKIESGIGTLEAMVKAIDSGAKTGVITRKFPSWNASTIELENLQKRGTLDVISSVTFGALSESELKFAQDTSLPTNMNEQDLRQWVINKINAQRKLAGYLREQAAFLSVPGNTLNMWLEKGKSRPTGVQERPVNAAPSSVPSGAPPTFSPEVPKGFRVIR